jgi:hypothetical protein
VAGVPNPSRAKRANEYTITGSSEDKGAAEETRQLYAEERLLKLPARDPKRNEPHRNARRYDEEDRGAKDCS